MIDEDIELPEENTEVEDTPIKNKKSKKWEVPAGCGFCQFNKCSKANANRLCEEKKLLEAREAGEVGEGTLVASFDPLIDYVNPLCHKVPGRRVGPVNEPVTYMIISDWIRHNWIRYNRVFEGSVKGEISRVLNETGVNIKECYFTSLVKCPTVAGQELERGTKEQAIKKHHSKSCSIYLEEEIATNKPKVIIALGAQTFEFFFPGKKLADNKCQAIWHDKYQCYVVSIYHVENMLLTAEFDMIIARAFQQAHDVLYKATGIQPTPVDYKKITTIEGLKAVLNRLKEVPAFSFDIETSSLHKRKCHLLSIGMSWKENTGISFPIFVKDEEACQQYLAKAVTKEDKAEAKKFINSTPFCKPFWGDRQEEATELIKQMLATPAKKIAHNGWFDTLTLRWHNLIVHNYAADTMIMHHLLDEGRSHALDDLSWLYTDRGGYKMAVQQYLESSESSYAHIPTDVLLEYNAGDADVTLRIYNKFKTMIYAEQLEFLLAKIDMPTQRMFMDISFTGMMVDKEYLQNLGEERGEDLIELKLKIAKEMGQYYSNLKIVNNSKEVGKDPTIRYFNFNSTDDLRELIYDKLGAKVSKRTESGAPSTDEETLKKLAKKFSICKLLIEYRGKAKTISTYVNGIMEAMDEDNKVHADYLLTGTVTGRLSSKNPNCFDEKTEILTPLGFRLFSELLPTDTVAQWDKGCITFVKPTSFIKYPYKGNLIALENQHIDLCVTPDHRCLVQNRRNKKYKVVSAENYPTDFIQPQAGLCVDGKESLLENEIILLCAAQADGHYHKDGLIEWRFRKKRKYGRLVSALTALGVDFNTKTTNKRGLFRVSVGKFNPITAWIKTRLPEKVWGAWILNLNSQTRELLCEELFLWDGCSTRLSEFSSSDKISADNVQALFSLTNRRALLHTQTFQDNRRPHYYVRVGTRKERLGSMTTNISKREVPYTSNVYCVSVPSSYIVVRRNNKVSVTGNCQNIPREKAIKKVYIASPGYILGSGDLSQAELRVAGGLSNDMEMRRIFANDEDIHRALAADINKCRQEEVTKEQRTHAKAPNFLALYAGGPGALRSSLAMQGVDITESYAEKMLDTWKKKFKSAWARVEGNGRRFVNSLCIKTFFNRRRRAYKQFPWSPRKTASQEREGTNFEIQSHTCDMFKVILLNMLPEMNALGVRFVNMVHDSIVLECPIGKEIECARIWKKHTWVYLPELNGVQMKSDFELGQNYGELVKIDLSTIETDAEIKWIIED